MKFALLTALVPLCLFVGALIAAVLARRYWLCALLSCLCTVLGLLWSLVEEIPLEELTVVLLLLTLCGLWAWDSRLGKGTDG